MFLIVAESCISSIYAVIITLPSETPVTTPDEEIVAIVLLQMTKLYHTQ